MADRSQAPAKDTRQKRKQAKGIGEGLDNNVFWISSRFSHLKKAPRKKGKGKQEAEMGVAGTFIDPLLQFLSMPASPLVAAQAENDPPATESLHYETTGVQNVANSTSFYLDQGYFY